MTETEKNLNLNTTASAGSQPLFQAALNRHIITKAKPKLVHHQFGQPTKIPSGKTKTVTWDKMNPLPKAKTPLTEGVTPKGTAINISRITDTPKQYGAYVSTTDEFDFYKNDPSPELLRLNEILADNAGETQDSLTADVLASGTNVQYAGGKNSRSELTEADVMTVEEIRKAVRTLKNNKANPIGRDFVAIVDPDVAFDLMSDDAWEKVKTYCDPKDMYSGEIGRLYGVRFVETTEAKVFRGEDLATDKSELLVAKIDGAKLYVADTLTQEEAAALSGRTIVVNGFLYTVSSATAGENGEAYLTCSEAISESVKAGMRVYPGEGTANGKPVHATLVIGRDAYGVTDPKANLETIVKALGSAGSADPLNQRGTIGWKCHHLAKILVDEYMVRIESVATAD
ncbi:MAG: N4-gp56 family major capsid protein [Ruminococcaceae bacterium]|nr:N4-gp56 family major capsid protein [Oscillospiraceae bacterium]